jgi:ferredoxin-NADP reductase
LRTIVSKQKKIISPKGFHICIVQSVKPVGKNQWHISFYSNTIIWDEYLPGQYVSVFSNKKEIKCWIASHYFGANLPSIIIDKKYTGEVKQGDFLYISKPEGTFILNPISNYKRSFIFIAQDEGNIPLYVMLQSLLFVENMSKAAYYGITKNEEGLFFNEIDFLRNMVHGRLKCQLEFNKNTFNTNKLNELFAFTKSKQQAFFFVCGGKALIDKTADFMLKNKIPLNQLNYFKTPL